MVKALISGYYGYKNFGDELILSILTEHLKAQNIDITVLSSDVEYTKNSYNVNAIKNFDIYSVINEIKNSDVIISGGGSLLQDVTSIKSLIYYAFIISLGIIFNKKVLIFAQGIGPLKSKFSQIIVKNILKCCSYISVRDENSQKLLTDWGIKSDLVCDPVYSLNISHEINKEEIIGIQLRDFSSMNYELLQKLALLIKNKFSDKKIEIFSLQKSIDYALCKNFQNILASIAPNINTEIIEDDIVNRISKLKYLIGMRFHALLIGIICGVKTCAINYDIKVEKLAQNAKIPIISMNASENFEEIYRKIQNLDIDNLLQFANSKRFDWTEFDRNIIHHHPLV